MKQNEGYVLNENEHLIVPEESPPQAATNEEALRKEITELKKELKESNEQREFYYEQNMSYLSRALKYEHAFKAVMEEITRVKR